MPKGSGSKDLILAVTLTWVMLAALTWGPPVHAGSSDGGDNTAATTEHRSDSVSALGRIEPEHGVIVLAVPSTPDAVNGPLLTKLLVEAGDNVTEGQLLAETDVAGVEEASVALAKAELELAGRQAEMAVGQEQEACSRADVAERTAARAMKLLKRGATSSEEADVASGDAKALSGSCASARIATKAAAAAVEVARSRLGRAEIALARCYVRAPMDGRVLRILKRPGELVAADGLLQMGRVSRMYAIAEVYETDIGHVHKGQKATVTSKALDGPLTGVVERVRLQVRKQDATGTDPVSRKDARIIEVEVLLDQPEAVASLTNLQVEVLIHP
jgi:HlyD family secretion protein